MWAKIKKWHENNEYLVWIVLGVSLLRIPSLFEPYWYGDEGVYLTLGLAMRRGLTLYSQIHDNKPPLLYLFSALSGNLMWLRVVLMAWNAGSVFLMGKLAENIFQKKWMAYLIAGVFGVLTTLPWLEGNIANGEIFMIGPAIAGVLLLIQKPLSNSPLGRGEYTRYMAVGLLFSIGFLFKVPIAFDLFGVGLWMVFFQKKEWFSGKGLKNGILVVIGFAVPVLLTIVYYWLRGAGKEYISAAFLQNVSYLSSWGSGSGGGGSLLKSGLGQRLVISALASGLVWLLTRKEDAKVRLIYIWLIWSMFGALLSGRPYPHYLIEMVAPAALLVGVVLSSKPISLKTVATLLVVGLCGFAVKFYQFYFYPVGSYYRNFYRYITKQTSIKDYYQSFDSKVAVTYKVSMYLKERTNPEDTIFVWGDEPFVYALAERLPPGRFTVAYHVIGFDGKAETVAAIDKKQSVYVVMFADEPRFNELNSLLMAKYALVAKIEQALIYRRVIK